MEVLNSFGWLCGKGELITVQQSWKRGILVTLVKTKGEKYQNMTFKEHPLFWECSLLQLVFLVSYLRNWEYYSLGQNGLLCFQIITKHHYLVFEANFKFHSHFPKSNEEEQYFKLLWPCSLISSLIYYMNHIDIDVAELRVV